MTWSFSYNTARYQDRWRIRVIESLYLPHEPLHISGGGYDISMPIHISVHKDKLWIHDSLRIPESIEFDSEDAWIFYTKIYLVRKALSDTPILESVLDDSFERFINHETPQGTIRVKNQELGSERWPTHILIDQFDSMTITEFANGDSTKDGVFNQRDIVQVLSANKYLTDEPALWADGDWNGDGLFNQLDIIAALPNYGVSANAAMVPVPEPSTLLLLCVGLVGLWWRRR